MNRSIRALGPADAAAAHALRQQALRDEPAAFGASPGDAHESLAAWTDLLGRAAIYGGFAGAALHAIAGLALNERAKTRHKARIWGVYVVPAARGGGLGRALVAHVIAEARPRAEWLDAGVAAVNLPALRLYEGLGFSRYGIEPAGLRIDGQDIAVHLLTLRL